MKGKVVENTNETSAAKKRIQKAHTIQQKRFKKHKGLTTNSDMGAKEIDTLACITKEAESALVDAAGRLRLSPRGYHRTIKLARTIADLAESERVEKLHMLEALQYRPKESY